jgi:2-phosphosulfolactate phosphatase
MTWHIIEGAAGCAYAVENNCVAVIVDALRASATAAMLLHAGATDLLVTREVEEAFAAKEAWPDALLFGERGGLPPDGFDYGNSPRDATVARGRRVIFTTTTGAGCLVACWGAHTVYMGSTVNASAVARVASTQERDVVLIPAGLATDPAFDAEEDWVAAAHIARTARATIGEGAAVFEHWIRRIENEGIDALFASAPHAAKLRAVDLEADVAYCAQVDLTDAVPVACEQPAHGVVVRRHV